MTASFFAFSLLHLLLPLFRTFLDTPTRVIYENAKSGGFELFSRYLVRQYQIVP